MTQISIEVTSNKLYSKTRIKEQDSYFYSLKVSSILITEYNEDVIFYRKCARFASIEMPDCFVTNFERA